MNITSEMRQYINLVEAAIENPSDEFLTCLAMFAIKGIDHDGMQTEKSQRIIKCFDAEMPVMQYEWEVFRGMNFPDISAYRASPWHAANKGDILTIPGYVSTSADEDIAKRAAYIGPQPEYLDPNTDEIKQTEREDGYPVLYEIQTMPGARAIYVPHYDKYYKAGFSYTDENGKTWGHIPPNERELVINRESKFRVDWILTSECQDTWVDYQSVALTQVG